MLSAIWRASVASGTTPEAFDMLLAHLPETPCAVRLEGLADSGGRLCRASGFNYVVSEGPEMSDVLDDIVTFLASVRPLLDSLPVSLGFSSELDLGFGVGGDAHFTRTVRFSPQILAGLASCSITLAVSGYPSSDD